MSKMAIAKEVGFTVKRWEFGVRSFLEIIKTEITYNFLTFVE